MKFTYPWLIEHLSTKASLDDVKNCLTNIGLEVESNDQTIGINGNFSIQDQKINSVLSDNKKQYNFEKESDVLTLFNEFNKKTLFIVTDVLNKRTERTARCIHRRTKGIRKTVFNRM